jgi:competence ComEA-like helix-hairpin-helix protein
MKARMRACSIVLVMALVWLVAWPLTVTAATRGHEGATETSVGGPVNINTAGVKELTALDGIGKKLAQKIVEYREAHGQFKKPEELRKVEGVGKGLWERNRDRIVTK